MLSCILILLALSSRHCTTDAFQIQPARSSLHVSFSFSSQTKASTTTALQVGWAMDSNEEVLNLFTRAKDCVYNDDGTAEECSVEDASELLQDLTFLLSNCRIGNLGTDNAVCEDQDVAADVVARLRLKSSPTAAAAVASGAVATTEVEENQWASLLWKILFEYEIPVAILFYFACIFCMIHFGEFGVNQTMDLEEMNAHVNEYYMTATDMPSTFFLYHPQPF